MLTTYVFVNPLVAMALGIWFAGEQLRPVHLVSGFLILASVCVLTVRIPRPRTAAASKPSPEIAKRWVAAEPLSEAKGGFPAHTMD